MREKAMVMVGPDSTSRASRPEHGLDVVVPGDPRYELLGHADNYRFVARPRCFVLARSPEQVERAVRDAVTAGRRVAARSGGHCSEAFVANEDVDVVVDLSPMAGVRFDPDEDAFLIEAGATVGPALRVLYRDWGVTLPVGFCMGVAAGGHICGGGYGPLSRTLGLSVDHLAAVEVVVVDAVGEVSRVVARRDATGPEHDLWWAHTGGGGGNFGIVTRYWMRTPGAAGAPGDLLPRPPRAVHVAEAAWDWSAMNETAFTALVRAFLDWQFAHSAPGAPDVDVYAVLRCLHRSAGAITLHAQVDADAPDAAARFDAFLAALAVGVDVDVVPTVRRRTLPWLAASRYLAVPETGAGAIAVRRKVKSADLAAPHRDEQIAAAWRHLSASDYDGPDSSMEYIGYGGRVNEVLTTATAVPRGAVVKVFYMACWHEEDEDDAHLTWLRHLYRDMHAATGGVPVADGVTTGAYVNYADVDLADPEWNTSGVPWHDLYYGPNHPRLQRVKARWDPGDRFRHALSIRPAPNP